MGSLVIRRLQEEFWEQLEVVALGTNAIATTQMMKARANKGASGENAVIWNVKDAHIIIGPLSIVLANGMLGEVTPAMAAAVAGAPGKKFLLPLNQEGVVIAGLASLPLPPLVERVVIEVKEYLQNV